MKIVSFVYSGNDGKLDPNNKDVVCTRVGEGRFQVDFNDAFKSPPAVVVGVITHLNGWNDPLDASPDKAEVSALSKDHAFIKTWRGDNDQEATKCFSLIAVGD